MFLKWGWVWKGSRLSSRQEDCCYAAADERTESGRDNQCYSKLKE
jgi:hypothetical protein